MPTRTVRYVISVLIPDRVGILRDIATAVTDLGGNIGGISQTVVAGYFTVTLAAEFPASIPAGRLREDIRERFAGDRATVEVVLHDGARGAAHRDGGDPYIVTLTGPDRRGVLKAVTTFLAGHGINIEAWYVGSGAHAFTHVGEVTMPPHLDLKQVQDELREAVAPVGQTACLQHANIFRATNEIGPIKRLLGDPRHA